MNQAHVLDLLKANQNEADIEKWKRRKAGTGELKSYGIGLTVLRKLAKQIGRNHTLALELWNSDIYDAKVIAVLIDDPKEITRDQVEAQIEHMKQGYLAHVFSSCDAPLSKTPFAADLMMAWTNSKDKMRRICGYGLLYELSKSKKKNAPEDAFFLERIEQINNNFHQEHKSVQGYGWGPYGNR